MTERRRYSVIFTALIVGLTAMAAATPTHADQPNGQFFIGFWEGIDPLDGSTVQLSITDNDQDGVFDYIYRESFLSACFTAQNTLGRGYLIGTATVVEQGVIEILADSVCVNDYNSKEDPVELTFRHSAAPKGDIQIVPQGDFPDIFMHRTGD